jgi:hypothetical protein
MKRPLGTSALLLSPLLLAALCVASSAQAFPNSQARVQLHLGRPDLTASCSDLDATKLSVPDLDLKGIGGPWVVWVLVTETRGLGGVSFSIAADEGVNIVSWYPCGDLQFPVGPWPRAGASMSVVWTECAKPANGIVPVGFFVVDEKSEGTIRIFPHESFGEIQLSDCMFHVEAVPDSATSAVAVWPDSASSRLRSLAWYPAKDRPEPAEPDSVILAREAAWRTRQVMPETLMFQTGADSATAPAITDSTGGPTEER